MESSSQKLPHVTGGNLRASSKLGGLQAQLSSTTNGMSGMFPAAASVQTSLCRCEGDEFCSLGSFGSKSRKLPGNQTKPVCMGSGFRPLLGYLSERGLLSGAERLLVLPFRPLLPDSGPSSGGPVALARVQKVDPLRQSSAGFGDSDLSLFAAFLRTLSAGNRQSSAR